MADGFLSLEMYAIEMLYIGLKQWTNLLRLKT